MHETYDGEAESEDRSYMVSAVLGFIPAQAIYVATRLGIADLLAPGPKTAEELAALTGTEGRFIYRLLRYLASLGIFRQEDGGRFGQSSRSEWLRSGVPGSLQPTALYWAGLWWEPFGWLTETIRTGQTGFQLAHGRQFFDFLAADPEAQAIFDRFMAEMPTRNIDLPSAYDFSSAGVIVDVGGGVGHHLAAVLKANQSARGVLIDLPNVAASAREFLESSGVSERCDVIEGSFFETVPAGGDVYLLGNILHDWDDESCLRILARCRQAMHATSVLLVIENVVTEDAGFSQAKRVDIVMMVGPGGQERTRAELASLFSRSGFELRNVITPGDVSLVEAVPV